LLHRNGHGERGARSLKTGDENPFGFSRVQPLALELKLAGCLAFQIGFA
jgi:hypothetical protein